MKKLMVLAAVAAMAFGAWAADLTYGYTWTIDINNIASDYELPSDLRAELIDSSGKLIGVLDVGMFNASYNLDLERANQSAVDSKLHTTYTSGELQLNADDVHNGKMAVHMTVAFKTTDNLYQSYSPQSDPTPTKSLKVVLSGTDKATSQTNYQELNVGWTEQEGTRTFGAAGQYAPTSTPPIPEPTSGLLMLLGMAGLALKRKRA